MHLYRPTLRLAGFATLPSDIIWEYVEAPSMPGLCSRHDLRRSDYRYGIISTDRALSADELRRFDLVPA